MFLLSCLLFFSNNNCVEVINKTNYELFYDPSEFNEVKVSKNESKLFFIDTSIRETLSGFFMIKNGKRNRQLIGFYYNDSLPQTLTISYDKDSNFNIESNLEETNNFFNFLKNRNLVLNNDSTHLILKRNFINLNIHNYLGLHFLEDIDYFLKEDPKIFTELYSHINPIYFKTPSYSNIKKIIENTKPINSENPYELTDCYSQDGQKVNIANFNDELIVIHFWAVNCRFSLKMIAEIKNKLLNYKQVKVISYLVGDTSDVEKWKEKTKEIPWLNCSALQGKLDVNLLKIGGFQASPMFLFLDKERKIVSVQLGTFDFDYVLNEIINSINESSKN